MGAILYGVGLQFLGGKQQRNGPCRIFKFFLEQSCNFNPKLENGQLMAFRINCLEFSNFAWLSRYRDVTRVGHSNPAPCPPTYLPLHHP